MQNIILAVTFIVIPAIVVLLAVSFGFKRNIFQAGAKLLMTILSIVITAVLVKLITPNLIVSVAAAFGAADSDLFRYFAIESAVSADVVKLLSSLIVPLIFFAVYFVVSLVFLLLYLIPGKLLSNKAMAKRATLKENADTKTECDESEQVEATENAVKTEEKKNVDWKKIGLRAGTVACCVLSALLVFSAFALPITTYSRLAVNITNDLSDAVVVEGDLAEAIEVVQAVGEYPAIKCYSILNYPVSSYFDSFKAINGEKVVVSKSISSALSMLSLLSDMESMELNSAFFYNFADGIGENPFIQNTITQVVRDLCNAWLNGESMFGIEMPLDNDAVTNVLLKKLSECNDISVALRAVGDALAMQETMMNTDQSVPVDTQATIGQVFDNITADSADMIKSFVSEEVLSDLVSMPSSMAQSVSGFVGGVVDGIVAIKENPDLSDAEKEAILEKEAKAMATILDMTSNAESVTPNAFVGAIVDSNVITQTIQNVTDNGNIQDPYEIGDAISDDFTNGISDELKNNGVEENSELYNSIMALLGK